MHKQRLVEAGLCGVIPQLISNHRLIMNDVRVQAFGLECIFELCNGTNEARAQLVEAGVMEALVKVSKAEQLGDDWRDLARGIVADFSLGSPALLDVVVVRDESDDEGLMCP